MIITITFTPFTVFLFIPMLLKTYYELGENELRIKSGLGKGKTIDLSQIVSAFGTKNPISSPALSMDRIELKYKYKSGKNSDSIVISPKDKEEFLRQLKLKNKDIEISTDVKPMAKGYRVVFGITAAIIAASGVMVLYGMLDPAVSVRGDSIKISGMYGRSVYFSEIVSVTLVEKSMREIYAGEGVIRTNGYGGIGQSNKGHFRSTKLGAHMLFVQSGSAPTIRIERQAGDIFISFRDGEKTYSLYREISRAMR